MDRINFRNWAFRFIIWLIIINGIIAYLIATHFNLPYTVDNTGEIISRLGLVATLLLVLSLLFIILSIVKKEKRNYKFWVVIVGLFVFGIAPLLLGAFSYLTS